MTLGYVFFTLLVVALLIHIPDLGERLPRFHEFVSSALLAGPLVLTVLHLNNMENSFSSIRQLAILYIEIILMFGIIYFYLVSSPENNASINGDPAISGIDSKWVLELTRKEEAPGKTEQILHALQCLHDCLHFSLITSTTVGYGDMVPKKVLPKVIVDIQVLICLFLISFGAGAVFSQSRKTRDSSSDENTDRLNQLEERIEALEKNVGRKAKY
jgi:hypothetical protein